MKFIRRHFLETIRQKIVQYSTPKRRMLMRKIKIYWKAVRAYAFTITIIQITLGSIIAKWENPELKFNYFYFVLALVGAVVAHAASNVISDYYDFKKNVDRKGTFGSSGVLVEELMTPKELFNYAIVLFFIAFLIGLYFVIVLPNKFMLIILIVIGAFLGIFYTASPIGLKYYALGDISVFLAYGPVMTLGAYFVQTGSFSWTPILFSLPLAFLVDAVLHGNNLRDIENDKVVNIKTVPIILGEEKAKKVYYGLIFSAYISQVLLIIFANLPFYTLISLLSLPLAIKLLKMVKNKEETDKKVFALIDMYTSQFHLLYGVLLIAGLFVSYLF